MNYIYALVTFGYGEDYGFTLIKIDKEDKKKFTKYCKFSKSTNSFYEENLFLLAFLNDYESVSDTFEEYSVMNIHEHQSIVRKALKDAERSNIRDEFNIFSTNKKMLEGLLKFEFKSVE